MNKHSLQDQTMDSSYEAIARWCAIIYCMVWLCTRSSLFFTYIRGLLTFIFISVGLRRLAVSAYEGTEIRVSDIFGVLHRNLWLKTLLLGTVFSFLWNVPLFISGFLMQYNINSVWVAYYFIIFQCAEVISVEYIQNPVITYKELMARLLHYRRHWRELISQQVKAIWLNVVCYVFFFVVALLVDYSTDSNIRPDEVNAIMTLLYPVHIFVIGPKVLLKTTRCVLSVSATEMDAKVE